MNNYIMHFATYTFAMIGFIVLMLYIYKKAVTTPQTSKNKGYLRVENTMKISPTKTIYVIKAGTERFLIAGDSTNTTMLAKLDENNLCFDVDYQTNIKKNLQDAISMKN